MAESVPAEVRAARLATARLATERRRIVEAGTRAGADLQVLSQALASLKAAA